MRNEEENRWLNKEESRLDCVTRLIREETRLAQHSLRRLFIDVSAKFFNLPLPSATAFRLGD